jgi:hypothetical protein
MTEKEITRQEETARRILNLIPFWDWPGTEEETATEIFNTISTDPVEIINFLLDRIEEDEA